MPANALSVLAKIIDRSGPLPAVSAGDGAALRAGVIQVCVPDRHLFVAHGRSALSEGPTENGYRPAINTLFRSAALSYGRHSICVLLSGVLDDGVLGAAAIRARGGTMVVQHPGDALYPAIPMNAIRAGVVDHQVAAGEVGAVLAKLTETEVEARHTEPDENMELENRIAMGRRFSTTADAEKLGPHSGYTCPDCSGSLMTLSEGNYRCWVGHAWSADALLDARDDEVDGALRVALRSLQEKAKLSRKLAENAGSGMLFKRYTQVVDEAERALTILGKRLSIAGSVAGERGGG